MLLVSNMVCFLKTLKTKPKTLKPMIGFSDNKFNTLKKLKEFYYKKENYFGSYILFSTFSINFKFNPNH